MKKEKYRTEVRKQEKMFLCMLFRVKVRKYWMKHISYIYLFNVYVKNKRNLHTKTNVLINTSIYFFVTNDETGFPKEV
jgi:hypothetical protein